MVPRPIGWISTISRDGIGNLAPYSQFQNLSYDPPMVMFAANKRSNGDPKDTVRNAQDTGEFVWNMATYDQRDAVNRSSQDYPWGVDEMEKIGLEHLPSRLVKPLRVASSSASTDRPRLGLVGISRARKPRLSMTCRSPK